MLAALLASFPPGVLPPYRRRREYVSAVLARNEVFGGNPYSRRLFLRAAHGYYVLNPALQVEVKGEWVDIGDLMHLPLLLESFGPQLDYLSAWMARTREQVARDVDAVAAARSGAGARPALAALRRRRRKRPAEPS